MPAARLNWSAIGTEYATSGDDCTHEFLAGKYGCNAVTVSKQASKRGWAKDRLAYRRKVAIKTEEKASTLQAEIQARHIKLGQEMQTIGRAGFKNLFVVNEKGEQVCTVKDPDQIRQLIATGADIERKAAGLVDTVAGATAEAIARALSEYADKL